MNDYSEYLNIPGMLAYIEMMWQKNKHIHIEQSNIVNDVVRRFNLKSVVEFGCATGNTAALIACKNYTGIDKNAECISYAITKNPGLEFINQDIRQATKTADLAFCFAFLKHFSLEEWQQILFHLGMLGDYLIFDMPVGETKDDGTEFHHIWMSLADIKKNIKAVGMDLVETINQYSLEPVYICKRK